MIEAQPELGFRPPLYSSPQQLIDGGLPPTKGLEVASWMERWLVHGEGDFQGRPVRLTPHERYILEAIYEYDPKTGRLLHDGVIIGISKGNSKTEMAGFIGLAELYGPIRPLASPHVVVQAASYDQADEVYHAASMGITEGPLASRFQVYDTKLYPHVGGGIMERLAAVGDTSDGAKPTCVIGDELHRWTRPNQISIYKTQRQNLRKRQVPRHGGVSGSLQVSISTAGDDPDSLLGQLFGAGVKQATGEMVDEGTLFLWWAAEKAKDEDLSDPVQLRQAILAANPAVGYFMELEQIEKAFRDPTTERHDFERFHLNRWVSAPQSWISPGAWDDKGVKPRGSKDHPDWPPGDTRLVLGFKGAYDRGSTALVGWTLPDQGEWSDYGFVVEAWEPNEKDPDWTVPREEVDAALYDAMARWKVAELAADPVGWVQEFEGWEKEYGSRRLEGEKERVRGTGAVLKFETAVSARMGPACDRFKADVVSEETTLQHSGDVRLARHVRNCHRRKTRYGAVIVQDKEVSPRRIDIAQAAVIARQRAMHQPEPQAPSVSAGF